MKTTEQVIDSIDDVLEKPVIGCPTIHNPNELVRRDFDAPIDWKLNYFEAYSPNLNQSDLDSILQPLPEGLSTLSADTGTTIPVSVITGQLGDPFVNRFTAFINTDLNDSGRDEYPNS